jgi:ubiquinone/menaquinone biosynthesis C-methylase UbiE
MNCDRLASSYRWIEYLRYGRALERCRTTMLAEIADARNALVIGDGDGRFSTAFLLHNKSVEIDSIDLSGKMIELARRRISRSAPENMRRIQLQQDDIRTAAPGGSSYDVIATHFFFDVFSTAELKGIIDRVSRWTAPHAFWVVSEFDLPPPGWHRAKARFWLRVMYAFFRLAANLRNQRLPAWRSLLCEAGFVPRKQVRYDNGFIVAELWQRESLPVDLAE